MNCLRATRRPGCHRGRLALIFLAADVVSEGLSGVGHAATEAARRSPTPSRPPRNPPTSPPLRPPGAPRRLVATRLGFLGGQRGRGLGANQSLESGAGIGNQGRRRWWARNASAAAAAALP
jgi:hypothetical protein